MNKRLCFALCCLLVPVQEANASGDSAVDLSAEAPRCMKTKNTRPKLQAELGPASKQAIRTGWYSPLKADFNGDGWCDFAWAVPYPVNSKMESYFLDDLLTLGGAQKWRLPFKGKGPPMFGLDTNIWPRHRVDLSDVSLVFPASGGAPYVLGIQPDGLEFAAPGCREYISVHRWDNEVDAFKKTDAVTRDLVIAFYYANIGQRCERPAEPRKP